MNNAEAARLKGIDAWADYVAQCDDDREWGPIHAAIIELELEERHDRETGHVTHRL
jgi:hypothetical protein